MIHDRSKIWHAWPLSSIRAFETPNVWFSKTNSLLRLCNAVRTTAPSVDYGIFRSAWTLKVRQPTKTNLWGLFALLCKQCAPRWRQQEEISEETYSLWAQWLYAVTLQRQVCSWCESDFITSALKDKCDSKSDKTQVSSKLCNLRTSTFTFAYTLLHWWVAWDLSVAQKELQHKHDSTWPQISFTNSVRALG